MTTRRRRWKTLQNKMLPISEPFLPHSTLNNIQCNLQTALRFTSLEVGSKRILRNELYSLPLSLSRPVFAYLIICARGGPITHRYIRHSHFTYFCNADCNLKTAIAVHNHMPSNWCPWKSPFFVVSVITHSHHFNSSVSLLLGVAGMVPKPSR